MTSAFRQSLIDDYMRDGYVVFRRILPLSLIADLRRVADHGRELARKKGGRQAQRLEPVANWEIDQKPFEDYRNLAELREAIRRLLSPRHTYGNPEIYLGVLIEPEDLPYCVAWHQDWRHFFPASRPCLTVEAKRDLDLFNQMNCALYQDDCIWVVPGSHARDDTPAERQAFPEDVPPVPILAQKSSEEREQICLDYCRSMPGAKRLHLDPGDVLIYRNTLWHMASYLPYVKRATILDAIDTPAYREWRSSFGFDEESAKQTTTRSVDASSAPPASTEGEPVCPNRGAEDVPARAEVALRADQSEPPTPEEPQDVRLPLDIHDQLGRAIAQETAGEWTLLESSRRSEHVLLRIQSGDQGVVDIDIARVDTPAAPAFRILDGVAFSYLDNGYVLSTADLRHLDAVARKLRKAALRLTAGR